MSRSSIHVGSPSRTLVCADVSPQLRSRLDNLSNVTYWNGPDTSIPVELSAGTEIVIVRSPFVLSGEFVQSAPALRAVIRAGSGVDGLPMTELAHRRIQVHCLPFAAISVAEHAIGLLLSAVRSIPLMHASLVRGEWHKAEADGLELYGKTLLIIGFGAVGRHVAKVASGFGLQLLIVDPTPEKPEKARLLKELNNAKLAVLDEALSEAQFIVLCCPLRTETRSLLDFERIGRLSPNTVLVNVGRAQLVHQDALKLALENGGIFAAGLDVHNGEPTPDRGLVTLANVVGTPHIGAQTRDARSRIENEVIKLLEHYLHGADVE